MIEYFELLGNGLNTKHTFMYKIELQQDQYFGLKNWSMAWKLKDEEKRNCVDKVNAAWSVNMVLLVIWWKGDGLIM